MKKRRAEATEEFRRIFLPYVLIPVKDGRYVVANRHYKPLGVDRGLWIKYEDHPATCHIFGLTKAKVAKLAVHDPAQYLGYIYLYDDSTIPNQSPRYWAAYAERLNILAKLGIALTKSDKES